MLIAMARVAAHAGVALGVVPLPTALRLAYRLRQQRPRSSLSPARCSRHQQPTLALPYAQRVTAATALHLDVTRLRCSVSRSRK
jgi:hypothetical protein